MSTRRRFVVAWGVGAALALALFAVILSSGRDGLLDTDLFGGFYDGQARALLDGHIDVDPDVPGIEGFRIDGKTYIYQGVAPSLARVPILAVTDRLDGQLTGLSMLAAFCIALVYVGLGGWRVRSVVRGGAPLGRVEAVCTAVATFGIGSGTLLFLAGKAWVYHEALLWGAAACLASLVHLLMWMDRRGSGDPPVVGANLIAAAVAAGVAINTRSSIGVGPFVALGAVGVLLLASAFAPAARATRWAERAAGWAPSSSTRRPLAAAVVLGSLALGSVVLYAGVNHARFDSWFGVPLDRQILVETDPVRTEALDANGGSLFGLRYAPSVLAQVLRPDAIGTQGSFPFLAFPQRPAALGDVVFAERDWSSSVPASEPLLFLSAVAGVAVLVAPRRLLPGRDQVTVIRLPVLGGAAAGGAIVVFGYMAQRYLADLYPFLVLAGLVGLQSIAARRVDGPAATGGREPASARARWADATLVAVLVATSLWTAWANAALALQYGQEVAPGRTESERAAWIRTQDRWGGLDVVRVQPGDDLPRPTRVGQVAIVGECDGLYRSNGTGWYLVELGSAAGGARLAVERHGVLDGPVDLASFGDDRLVLEPLGGDAVRLVVEKGSGTDPVRSLTGPTFDLADGATTDLQVMADGRTGLVVVDRDPTSPGQPSEQLLRVELPVDHGAVSAVGDATVMVTQRPLETPTCEEITAGRS